MEAALVVVEGAVVCDVCVVTGGGCVTVVGDVVATVVSEVDVGVVVISTSGVVVGVDTGVDTGVGVGVGVATGVVVTLYTIASAHESLITVEAKRTLEPLQPPEADLADRYSHPMKTIRPTNHIEQCIVVFRAKGSPQGNMYMAPPPGRCT